MNIDKSEIEEYKKNEKTKHFFKGKKNLVKEIEKEEEMIKKCLKNNDNNYLLTTKNFKIKEI